MENISAVATLELFLISEYSRELKSDRSDEVIFLQDLLDVGRCLWKGKDNVEREPSYSCHSKREPSARHQEVS